jgi:RimJ/RimL family protein N-acetyltransferase
MKLPAEHPLLETPQLLLRALRMEDAPAIQQLAGAKEIASTTLLVPHPYLDGMAQAWIRAHPQRFQSGKAIEWAIVQRKSEQLCGCIGLMLRASDHRGELGYWVGVPYWGHGYATEAARAVIKWAFGVLELNRVCAHHFTRNPASGRVLSKAGLRHEGTFRQHILKWDQFEDIECYGVLRNDWREG